MLSLQIVLMGTFEQNFNFSSKLTFFVNLKENLKDDSRM